MTGIPRRSLLAGVAVACAAGSGASAEEPTELRFSDFYVPDAGPPLKYSEKLLALAGRPVVVRGYMAPPLKANSDFLVLTKEPVALCPFCESDNDWPDDIVVVYVKGRYSSQARLRVAGTLEVGSKTDEKTGFVSQLRLVDAQVMR